ncbi:hypothetical protein AbraIFM66951_004199 [Aspergillus brasiliensis]|uniref:Transcription factor domain-containing protein n=1 Tax=Aspergillus brasiliensis TaxID=319629 RepID=A0A9W6DTZ9_9EURO|nr:hypothetical protein AbraCBS73388_004629 [Aspergillus brasiliensis]GKZ50832.1 hypothetical protein AbraIFM66951_004199 [Aspergillus brasiliensis]
MPPPRRLGRKPGALGRYYGLDKARRKIQRELEKMDRKKPQKPSFTQSSSRLPQNEDWDLPNNPMSPRSLNAPTTELAGIYNNLPVGSSDCSNSTATLRVMIDGDSQYPSQEACRLPQIHKPAALMADLSGAVEPSNGSPFTSSAKKSINTSPTNHGSADADFIDAATSAHRLLQNPGNVALGLEKLTRQSLERGLGTLLVPEDHVSCKYPNYFSPAHSVLQLDIGVEVDPLELGLASVKEADYLFLVYFDKIHPLVGILDPLLHTVGFVRSRSALLLTWILAVAALFDHHSGALAKRLRMHGERVSKLVYKRGYKSVEIIQGYYISFLARSPALNIAEEHSWIYTSYASALAAELDLDQKQPSPSSLYRTGGLLGYEKSSSTTAISQMDFSSEDLVLRQRLVRNRERTWLRIFLWERAQSAIIGRMNVFPETDLTLSIDDWGMHPLADPVDRFTVAFIHLRRILAAVQGELKMKIDLQQTSDPHWVQKMIDNSLECWCRAWIYPLDSKTPCEKINCIYLRHVYEHGRLWTLSFTLHAYSHSGLAPASILAGLKGDCLNTAIRCCEDAVYDLEYTGEPLYCMLAPTWAMLSYAVIMALTLFPMVHSAPEGEDVELLGLAAQVATHMERAGTTPTHRFGIAALLGQHLRRILRRKALNLQERSMNTSLSRDHPPVPLPVPDQHLPIEREEEDESVLGNMDPFYDISTSMIEADSEFSEFLKGLISPGVLF